MILVLSLVLALVPLAGVAWIFVSGMISICSTVGYRGWPVHVADPAHGLGLFSVEQLLGSARQGAWPSPRRKKQHRRQRVLHLWQKPRALHRPRLTRAGGKASCRKGEFLMATQVATLARPGVRTSTGVMLPAFTLWWREIVRFYRQTGRGDRGAGFSPGFLGGAGIGLRNLVPFRRGSGPAALS